MTAAVATLEGFQVSHVALVHPGERVLKFDTRPEETQELDIV